MILYSMKQSFGGYAGMHPVRLSICLVSTIP